MKLFVRTSSFGGSANTVTETATPSWATPSLLDGEQAIASSPSPFCMAPLSLEKSSEIIFDRSCLLQSMLDGRGFFCFTYGPMRSGKTSLLLGRCYTERNSFEIFTPTASLSSTWCEVRMEEVPPMETHVLDSSLLQRSPPHAGALKEDSMTMSSLNKLKKIDSVHERSVLFAFFHNYFSINKDKNSTLQMAMVEFFCGEWYDLLGFELHNIEAVDKTTFVSVTNVSEVASQISFAQSRRSEMTMPQLDYSLSHLVIIIKKNGQKSLATAPLGYFVDLAGSDSSMREGSELNGSPEKWVRDTLDDLHNCLLHGVERGENYTNLAQLEQLARANGMQRKFRWACFLKSAISSSPLQLVCGIFSLRPLAEDRSVLDKASVSSMKFFTQLAQKQLKKREEEKKNATNKPVRSPAEADNTIMRGRHPHASPRGTHKNPLRESSAYTKTLENAVPCSAGKANLCAALSTPFTHSLLQCKEPRGQQSTGEEASTPLKEPEQFLFSMSMAPVTHTSTKTVPLKSSVKNKNGVLPTSGNPAQHTSTRDIKANNPTALIPSRILKHADNTFTLMLPKLQKSTTLNTRLKSFTSMLSSLNTSSIKRRPPQGIAFGKYEAYEKSSDGSSSNNTIPHVDASERQLYTLMKQEHRERESSKLLEKQARQLLQLRYSVYHEKRRRLKQGSSPSPHSPNESSQLPHKPQRMNNDRRMKGIKKGDKESTQTLMLSPFYKQKHSHNFSNERLKKPITPWKTVSLEEALLTSSSAIVSGIDPSALTEAASAAATEMNAQRMELVTSARLSYVSISQRNEAVPASPTKRLLILKGNTHACEASPRKESLITVKERHQKQHSDARETVVSPTGVTSSSAQHSALLPLSTPRLRSKCVTPSLDLRRILNQ